MFPTAAAADPDRGHARCMSGFLVALAAVGSPGSLLTRTCSGFAARVLGAGAARRRATPASVRPRLIWLSLAVSRRRSPGLPACSRWPGRSASSARRLAGLRLHRHHRRLPRPAASGRHPRSPACCWRSPISAARRRRSSWACRSAVTGVFQGMLLFFLLGRRCARSTTAWSAARTRRAPVAAAMPSHGHSLITEP